MAIQERALSRRSTGLARSSKLAFVLSQERSALFQSPAWMVVGTAKRCQKTFGNKGHQVKANQIKQSEDTCFWHSGRLGENSIGLLNSKAKIKGSIDGTLNKEDAQAIGKG